MSLNLLDLDSRTSKYMLEEVEYDMDRGKLYMSSRLSPAGQSKWPDLLKEAIAKHDDFWLANELRTSGMFNPTEQRRKPTGGFTTAKMSSNAPEVLAEGEFNRFYARGLCRRAIDDGIPHLIIYRARAVSRPRPESEAAIDKRIDAKALLDDLRKNIGGDTFLGIPAGPGSGISVKLP